MEESDGARSGNGDGSGDKAELEVEKRQLLVSALPEDTVDMAAVAVVVESLRE